MRGLKKFEGIPSSYFHTISLVREFTSMTREKGKLSSKRCGPLSKIRMLPFGNGVGACWPDSGGAPIFHKICQDVSARQWRDLALASEKWTLTSSTQSITYEPGNTRDYFPYFS